MSLATSLKLAHRNLCLSNRKLVVSCTFNLTLFARCSRCPMFTVKDTVRVQVSMGRLYEIVGCYG